jgi:hypothetical protein
MMHQVARLVSLADDLPAPRGGASLLTRNVQL